MINHKTKYLICWINFALVSMVYVIILSFGKSTDILDNENELGTKIISTGNGLKWYSTGTESFIPNLTYKKVKEIGDKIGNCNIRVLSEYDDFSVCYNEAVYDNKIRVLSYLKEECFIFDSEKDFFTEYDISSPGVWISENFLKKTNLSAIDAVGKYICVTIHGFEEYEYTGKVVGIIPSSIETSIAFGDIYFPYENIDYSNYYVDVVDYELPNAKFFPTAQEIINEENYYVSFLNKEYGYNNEFGGLFSTSAFGICIILIAIISIGLINVSVEIMTSNRDFYKMIYVCGCPQKFLLEFSILISGVQGFIGCVFGMISVFLIRGFMNSVIEYIMGYMFELMSFSFEISVAAIFGSFLICVIVSVICGIISYFAVFDEKFYDEEKTENTCKKKIQFIDFFKGVFLILGVVCIYFFAGVVTDACEGLFSNFEIEINGNTSNILNKFIYFISSVLAIFLFNKYANKKNNSDETIKRVPYKETKKIFIYSIVCVCIAYFVVYFIEKALNIPAYVEESNISEYFSVTFLVTMLFTVISHGFWTALGEEFLFRRLLFDYINKMWNENKMWNVVSIITSAAVFALLHDGSVTKIITFVFGIYLCFLYKKSGSISVCVVNHFLWNTLCIVFG